MKTSIFLHKIKKGAVKGKKAKKKIRVQETLKEKRSRKKKSKNPTRGALKKIPSH